MNIKAVIYDLDGTILDSEPLYYLADKKFIKRYGVDFTEEMQYEFIGGGNWNFVMKMRERYNITDDPHEMIRKKNKVYLDIARQKVRPFPEMVKLIQNLYTRQIPMAVASGSTQVIIEELIDAVNLRPYFRHLFSSEKVEREKPAPDIFLKTAEILNVPPENCLVLEDSIHGVNAAKAAGMYCVAVPSILQPPLKKDYYKADLLFEKGMSSFQAREVLAWLNLN